MKKFIFIIIGIILGIIVISAVVGYFKSNPNIIGSTNTTKPADNKATKPSTNTNESPKQTNTQTPVVAKSLTTKPWQWVMTSYSNGAKTTPKDATRFALTFKSDGTFSSSTDCNGVGGKYVAKDNTLTFSEMMSTEMFCQNSQETEYHKIFNESHTYTFTKDGELRIDLRYGAGYAMFK